MKSEFGFDYLSEISAVPCLRNEYTVTTKAS
jgi:hypothetical protein